LLRGHEVDLYEMGSHLGGQVRMAASAPFRADVGAITRWLADEVARLGGRVHLRTPVDPDLVIDARPDEVIVATGSTPRRGGFQLSSPSRPVPGGSLPHVFTVWDVLGFGGRATVGRHALVYDDTATFEAIAAADALLAAGATVTIVSRLEQLGANITYPPATVEASRERLFGAGVRFVPSMAVQEIRATEVVMHGIGNELTMCVPADTVVMATYHEPNAELADHLRAAGMRVHLAGNVNGTDTILAAIHSAAAVARRL
jgi:NADPH-dependent 2,4-dienoyl-CoA reductase/sulfur reductase-like enzyme